MFAYEIVRVIPMADIKITKDEWEAFIFAKIQASKAEQQTGGEPVHKHAIIKALNRLEKKLKTAILD